MVEGKAGSTSTSRKGRVYKFIKTDRGLFPFSVLTKAEVDQRKSTQLEQYADQYIKEQNLLPQPFATKNLLELQDNCAFFDACARQEAQDVVGQGWRLVPIDEEKKDQDEAGREEAETFLNDPNEDEDTIGTIIERSMIDWGIVGWATIEASRGDENKVNGLWHVPAHTIYVHKDRDKYVQIRGQRKRWFVKYGSEDTLNATTGKEVKGKSKDPANELIFKPRYYPQSDTYGAPPILPAISAVVGLIGIKSYNLAFFDNYGIPAALVTLEGEWEENSAKYINDFLDTEIKATDNAHKTLVLELPTEGKITVEPLSVDVKEGSFKIYMKELRDEVLVSYKMPPYRIGITEIGSLGENVAEEMTRIYVESIIVPLKKMTAAMITKMILQDGLGIEGWKFEWNPLDTRDIDALVDRWQKLFGMGVINADYQRKQIGLEERDDGGGKDYYILQQYLPESEGSVEKREREIEAFMEEYGEKMKRLDSSIKRTTRLLNQNKEA